MNLTAAILNNGSVPTGSPVRVRLYDGDPDAGGTQIGGDLVIAQGIAGGAVPRLVQMTWEDAPAGSHEVHMVVDPEEAIWETDPYDNRLSTIIDVPVQ